MTSEILNPNVSAVIVGFDGGINYWKLMFAASYVQDRSIPFIETNCDESFTRSGLVLPGTAIFVSVWSPGLLSLRFACKANPILSFL